MFRQSKQPTLMDRLPTTDLLSAAAAVRDRALDAADALAPHVEAARSAVSPHVDAARESLAPHVQDARAALGPRVEAVLRAAGPSLIAGANAWAAAGGRLEYAGLRSELTRREVARRAGLAAAALRGEQPRRRWPARLLTLVVGIVLGALGRELAKRLTKRDPLSSAFPSPGPRRDDPIRNDPIMEDPIMEDPIMNHEVMADPEMADPAPTQALETPPRPAPQPRPLTEYGSDA